MDSVFGARKNFRAEGSSEGEGEEGEEERVSMRGWWERGVLGREEEEEEEEEEGFIS